MVDETKTGLLIIKHFYNNEPIEVTQEQFNELNREGFLDQDYWFGNARELCCLMIGLGD